ncbi:hypothetical protein [uncultured Rikenella sp.]|uniref:hypothetical protein n=1 Tax=uncultured Rikenella sp. TaxID=368003 RepID=UPI002638A9D1|nr:hypothetical protein [uncultured Rikenella sp.]
MNSIPARRENQSFSTLVETVDFPFSAWRAGAGAAGHSSRGVCIASFGGNCPRAGQAPLNKFSQTPIKAPTGPRAGLAMLCIAWAVFTSIILCSARRENQSFSTHVETVDFPFSAWRAEMTFFIRALAEILFKSNSCF